MAIIFKKSCWNKENCYWNCCPGLPNRLRPQIELYLNSWQYPLINYLECPKLRSKRSTEPSHHVTKSILESTIEDVFEVEQQTVKSRVKRNDIIYDLEFNDPYWSKMWYLNRFGHFIFFTFYLACKFSFLTFPIIRYPNNFFQFEL